jgi:peptidoglycan biosynthesis protein MviN/MurJ (putative lipid II flippase)
MVFVAKFVLVMLSMILADVCWTMYFIEVEKRKAIKAGLWSAAILLFGSFITIQYVEDRRLLVAAIIGAFIGTACTVWYKNQEK